MCVSGWPHSGQCKIPCVFPFFPVFFQHKNNTILINKWPPPPLQPSFPPFYYIKLCIQAQEID